MQLYLVRMRRPGGGEDFFKIGVSENALNRFKYGTVRVLESDLSLRDKIARLAKSETYIPDYPLRDVYKRQLTYQTTHTTSTT